MKKIIIMIISPMLLLFIIWTIIALQRYGTDITKHHLNLEGMIRAIAEYETDFSMFNVITNVIEHINELHDLTITGHLFDLLETLNIDIVEPFKTLILTIATFLNPISSLAIALWVGVELVADLTWAFVSALNLILQILNFIFNPMFT